MTSKHRTTNERRKSVVTLLLCSAAAFGTCHGQELLVVNDGNSRYRIVVASQAMHEESAAASGGFLEYPRRGLRNDDGAQEEITIPIIGLPEQASPPDFGGMARG